MAGTPPLARLPPGPSPGKGLECLDLLGPEGAVASYKLDTPRVFDHLPPPPRHPEMRLIDPTRRIFHTELHSDSVSAVFRQVSSSLSYTVPLPTTVGCNKRNQNLWRLLVWEKKYCLKKIWATCYFAPCQTEQKSRKCIIFGCQLKEYSHSF